MAKTISDEKLKLSVIIDSNQAQKELYDLEKATRSLTEENKSLTLQKKQLEKEGKKSTEAYRDLTKTIKENNVAITGNKSKMKELQEQIGITGLTMKQLSDRANILKLSLRNAIPGSEAYRRYQEELNTVNTRMSELQGRATGTRASIDRLADGFNRYAAIGASVIAVFTGVVLSLQKMIDYNGQLSDAQANVMKTTRMSKKEVDELTKSFGLLQTRTSRIDLLKIAEEGGRIGVAKEEVGQFVEVMNKATVALGDSFTGGVGEVAEKLGKLKFLFKETKDLGVDQAYNAIGSAINELGADGVASERNISEFATRVGSLPDALKPTVANALALGAAFEESGVEAEIASRAYNIFLKQASTETAKFGKVMGISSKEVENLINADPMEFFLKFSEGMKGMDATDTAKTLDYLGINADGANKAIGAVSNNIGRFRSQIELSNKSFNEASSLMDEYDIKNNTLGATIEKVQKKIVGAFSSETLINGLTNIVNWIGKVLGATEDLDGSGQKWRNTLLFVAKAIAIVTAGLLTNVAWQKLVVLWTTRNTQATWLYNLGVKARALAEGVSIVASQLYAATTMLLTGNIRGATQAIRIMTATMMTTPWGLLLSLVAAVGVAYVAFSDEVDEASISQKNFSDINLQANQSISAQKKELETLTMIAKDNNQTNEVRKKAIERLNELIPDHIGILSLENIALAEGTSILKKYTDELYKNARAKAVQSKFDELANKRLEVESKKGKEYKSGVGNFMAKITGQGDDYNFQNEKEISDYILKNFGDFIEKRKDKKTGATLVNKEKYDKLFTDYLKASGLAGKKDELNSIDAQMKELESELVGSTIDDLKKQTEVKAPGYKVPDGSKEGSKTAKKYDNSYLEAERKAREEAYQAIMALEANKIALMEEGYAKELALEKFNSAKKVHDIESSNEAILNLQKQLDTDLKTAIKDGDDVKVTSIKNQQNLLLNQIKSNNDKICQEEELTNVRLSTIQEKAANDEIKTDQENFERAKVIRETKHNEALAALGTNAKAREALQKEFDSSEIAEEEKHLMALIEKVKLIIGKSDFDTFDLSLLNPEQVEEFKKLAEQLGLSLSKLNGQKKELAGKDSNSLESLGLGGKADIFGFSPENWEEFFSNLEKGESGINKMVFAVQALTNMYQMYSQFLAANEQAQLEKFTRTSETKKTKLKRQLDSGYLSQSGYNKQVEKIDADLAKKKADIDYKQAKRQKLIAAANIIQSTAQAILGLWVKPGFPAAIPLAAMVGVMGALQLATVMATPLPAKGYEKGLYPDYVNVKREQDGKMYRPRNAGKLKSGLVTQNSLMVAEGNKPEMVIDNRAWSRISPEVQNALIREIRGAKGFEQGYYKNNVLNTGSSSTTSAPSSTNSDAMLEMVLSVVSQCNETMKRLEERGIEAVVDPKKMKNIKNLKDGFKDFDNLKNKARK